MNFALQSLACLQMFWALEIVDANFVTFCLGSIYMRDASCIR